MPSTRTYIFKAFWPYGVARELKEKHCNMAGQDVYLDIDIDMDKNYRYTKDESSIGAVNVRKRCILYSSN